MINNTIPMEIESKVKHMEVRSDYIADRIRDSADGRGMWTFQKMDVIIFLRYSGKTRELESRKVKTILRDRYWGLGNVDFFSSIFKA